MKKSVFVRAAAAAALILTISLIALFAGGKTVYAADETDYTDKFATGICGNTKENLNQLDGECALVQYQNCTQLIVMVGGASSFKNCLFCSVPLYLEARKEAEAQNQTVFEVITEVYKRLNPGNETVSDYQLYYGKEFKRYSQDNNFPYDRSSKIRYNGDYLLVSKFGGDSPYYASLGSSASNMHQCYCEYNAYLKYCQKHSKAPKQKWDLVNEYGTDGTVVYGEWSTLKQTKDPNTDSYIPPYINVSNEHMYALRVFTGAASGKGISTIRINYTDEDGVDRSQLVMPFDGIYQTSLETAAKAGYVRTGYMSTLGTLGYEVKPYSELTPLESNSQDTFLVSFMKEVKEVNSIEILTDVSMTGTVVSWRCECMEFYKVNKLIGLDMNGTVSNSYYIDFEGTLLAKTVYTGTDKTGKLFSAGNGQESLFVITAEDKKTAYGSNVDDVTLKTSFTEEESETDFYTDFYVEVDLADVYGAGIESYINTVGSKKKLSELQLPETLAMQFNYVDANGYAKTVIVPVITSALSFAMQRGVLTANSQLVEFAGQGSQIIFKMRIYDFAEMDDSSSNFMLYYSTAGGENGVESLCGLQETAAAAAAHAAIKQKIAGNNSAGETDTLAYREIYVYAVEKTDAADTEETSSDGTQKASCELKFENNALLKGSVNLSPSYYTAASTVSGNVLTPSGSNTATGLKLIKLASGEAPIVPKYGNNRFLVVLKTADAGMAATTSEISMQLGYTTTAKGEEKLETAVNLSTACRDFYGYWPDQNGDDSSGILNTASGQYLYALVQIDNVDHFTSVALTLQSKAGSAKALDPWQCEDFAIYQLSSVTGAGERHAEWTDVSNGSTTSDRRYYRDFAMTIVKKTTGDTSEISSSGSETEVESAETGITDCVKLILLAGVNAYLDGNSPSKKISFTSKTVIEDITVTDWRDTDQIKKMTHEQTQADLKLAVCQKTYTVEVNVGSQKYSSGDDAGSANYFYFQLVFANGSSGYVQANQQLASDGFLEGTTASFTIQTNYDYGELTAVNVIPDDSSSNAQPYDKLKIDSITVSVDAGNNTSIAWTAPTNSDNCWVGIDYVEEEQGSDSITSASRDIEEIRTTYAISSRVVKSHLLIAICTDGAEGKTTPGFQAKDLVAQFGYTQLDGTKISAEKAPEVQVVQKICEFRGTEPITEDGSTVSDPTSMLRGEKWDLFIIDADNIATIDSVRLRLKSTADGANWYVKKIMVYRIDEDNGRLINKDDQYVLNGKVTAVTGTTEEAGGSFNTVNTTDLVMTFEEQNINVPEATAESYEQSRTPESVNDYLNLAVYMTKNDQDYSGVNMTGYVCFSNSFDSYYYATPTFKQRTTSDGQTVYYANGLGARNIVGLSSVYLKAEAGGSISTANAGWIVVQQVRSGTVIATYRIACGGTNVLGGMSFDGSSSKEKTAEYQVVTLQLGENTDTAQLTHETQDIAVAIRYTSSLGNSDAVYQSAFVFATDDDAYSSIAPYKQITLRFSENYVKEIKGIVVAVTGRDMSAQIESASIGLYNTPSDTAQEGSSNSRSDETDGCRCTAWYSITAGETVKAAAESTAPIEIRTNSLDTVKAGSRTFSVTSSTKGDKRAVVPMTMIFNTESVDGTGDNTPSISHVYMIISYKGLDNNNYVRYFDDILLYTDSSGTASIKSDSAVLTAFMEQNMPNIKSITLRPYDDNENTNIQWKLKSIDISYGDGAEQEDYTIEVNKTISEVNTVTTTRDGEIVTETNQDGTTISVIRQSLTILAYTENAQTGDTDQVIYDSYEDGENYPTIRISKLGGSVNFTTYLTDEEGSKNYDISVKAERSADGDSTLYLAKDDTGAGRLTFTPPTEDLAKDLTYTVTFTSKEDKTMVGKIYVVVEANIHAATVEVTGTDVADSDTATFNFVLSDKPTEAVELTVAVTSHPAGTGTDTSKDTVKTYTVKIPSGSKKGSLLLEIDAGFAGTLTAAVTKITGGGYDAASTMDASASCTVGRTCTVRLAAVSTAIDEGQDAQFLVTLSETAGSDMTVTVNVSSKEYTVNIPAGGVSGTVTVEKTSVGTLSAYIQAYSGGGFLSVDISGAAAQCSVSKVPVNAAVTEFTVDQTRITEGDELTFTLTLNAACTQDAYATIRLTDANDNSYDYTAKIPTGSTGCTVKIKPESSGIYSASLLSVQYGGFDSIDLSAAGAKPIEVTAKAEETTAAETTAAETTAAETASGSAASEEKSDDSSQ